jgi:hypothetical protein
MPADGPQRTRRTQRRGDLQRLIGPRTPAAGQNRANLERQYRGLIAQGRHPKYPGTLQVYKRDRIKNMTTPQLRKALQDAYRKPTF